MHSSCTYTSISSVVTPGATFSPARRSTSAATLPAWRIRSMISGALTRGSAQRIGRPRCRRTAAAAMWSGTDRTRADDALQHPALERLVAALVLAPAPAPARRRWPGAARRAAELSATWPAIVPTPFRSPDSGICSSNQTECTSVRSNKPPGSGWDQTTASTATWGIWISTGSPPTTSRPRPGRGLSMASAGTRFSPTALPS